MSMKVVVDRSACCGYGICADICPEVYKLDDHGIVFEYNDVVPKELEANAKEGGLACPQNAIKIVETAE